MNGQRPGELSDKAKEALAARDRQYRRYCKVKAAELRELYAEEPYGPALKRYEELLGRFTFDQADQFVKFVAAVEEWLSLAPPKFYAAALHLAAMQIVKIRTDTGLPPFDDPLPSSDDDVFQMVKQMLSPH